MEYMVLKNSSNFLCIELPKEFQDCFEIVCFRTQSELEKYLKTHDFKEAFSRKQFLTNTKVQNGMATIQEGLFVRHNEYFKKVRFTNIKWIEASRSYSYIYTMDMSRIITTHPLSEVKNKLPPELFIQTSRSFVVNKYYVDKFIGNMLYIGEQSFVISKKYRNEVLSNFLFLDSIKNTRPKVHMSSERAK